MNKIKIANYDNAVMPRYFADDPPIADSALRGVSRLAYIYIVFSLILSVTFLFSVIFCVIF